MSESTDRKDDSSLDFSSETVDEAEASGPLIGDNYDPRPQEDGARRNIAYALIGLLWVIVSALLILTACRVLTPSDVKEFSVVLGPIVTLVSAATGFYYGTKTNGA